MNNNPNFEGALGWDSPITAESSFVLLEPGEYDFKVENMTRGNYTPSSNSKIRDTSPKAELEITLYGEGESTTVTENLILHSKTEWKLSEFFISIGQKKPGEPLSPNWGQVIGATGRCEVEINEYTNREGQERKNNRILSFLSPLQNIQQPAQAAYQAPAQTTQQPTVPYQQPTQAVQPQPTYNPPQQNTAPHTNANPGFNF